MDSIRFRSFPFLGLFSAVLLPLTSLASHAGDHGGGPWPGGTPCKDNSLCYSHLCYISGYCAPDGPVEGTVVGGGACSTDSDCFSNYCVDRVCAADSSVRGKVAGGGLCVQDQQCYSSACVRRRCAPDSPVAGKMAAGGECATHTQCYSGNCMYQRCAPDGPAEGQAPGGGFCGFHTQCSSGVCVQSQCSPESVLEVNKAADGGKCVADENCQSTSRCLQNICTPKDGGNGHGHGHGQTSAHDQFQQGHDKLPAGAFCTQTSDCQTACVYGRCAPPSRFNPLAIADGGYCEQQSSTQGQCKSGQCILNVCAASYADRFWSSATAAGAPCSTHQMCYSGYCASGKCSSDSPAPLASSSFAHSRHRGQVPGGGLCNDDEDCYSNYCELRSMCGPDGPRRGTLASGAVCTTDNQCYSNFCFQRRCVAAAVGNSHQPNVGKVAPGGRCGHSDACSAGATCSDTYCKASDEHGHSLMSNLGLTRPSLSSVHWNGTCWHNAQCTVGRCLEHRCTVSWYQAEKYSSASTDLLHFGVIVLGVVISFLINFLSR